MATMKELFEVRKQAEDLSIRLLSMLNRESDPSMKSKLSKLDGEARAVSCDLSLVIEAMYESKEAELEAWISFVKSGDPGEIKEAMKEAV